MSDGVKITREVIDEKLASGEFYMHKPKLIKDIPIQESKSSLIEDVQADLRNHGVKSHKERFNVLMEVIRKDRSVLQDNFMNSSEEALRDLHELMSIEHLNGLRSDSINEVTQNELTQVVERITRFLEILVDTHGSKRVMDVTQAYFSEIMAVEAKPKIVREDDDYCARR